MAVQSPHAETLDRARRLADEGRHADALAAIREYLKHEPDDGEALNDAGALLYAAGRFDEAADYLRLAADCPSQNPGQALWNLAEVYLAGGRPAEVLPLFDRLEEVDLLTADLANRVAGALADRGETAGAVEALIRSFRVSPQQEGLLPIYQQVRSLRPKVAFFCESEDLKFLNDIYAFTAARFETRLFRGQSEDEYLQMLRWCDVAWIEWCTQQAVVVSQLPKVCRTVVRLHRYEAFRPWPEQVRWENIDALVTVGNSAVLDHLKARVPDLERRTRVVPIPNGVDLARFAFRKRRRGKNLACVGYINLRKNPVLLLQCFQKLHSIDPEYRLFFAGNCQDADALEDYLGYFVKEMGLERAVSFEGWRNDVAGWLEDKHYLVAASLGEGHPVNVIEAMARGLKPVIHVFPGCRDFFPDAYLWRTVDEFCQRILSEPYRPREYRDHVARHFSLKGQLDRINGLFLEFENARRAEREAAAADAESPEAQIYDDQWKRRLPKESRNERFRRAAVVDELAALGRRDLEILDLGCGRGILAPHLAPFGHVTGVDWSREGIQAARQLCPSGTFLCSDFFLAPLARGSFDVAVSVEVLEHLQSADQARYLALARDALKPGGLLVLTTPNRPAMKALDDDHRRVHGVPWSGQPIENWLTTAELAAMAQAAGFETVGTRAFVEWECHKDLHIFLTARKADDAGREAARA